MRLVEWARSQKIVKAVTLNGDEVRLRVSDAELFMSMLNKAKALGKSAKKARVSVKPGLLERIYVEAVRDSV